MRRYVETLEDAVRLHVAGATYKPPHLHVDAGPVVFVLEDVSGEVEFRASTLTESQLLPHYPALHRIEAMATVQGAYPDGIPEGVVSEILQRALKVSPDEAGAYIAKLEVLTTKWSLLDGKPVRLVSEESLLQLLIVTEPPPPAPIKPRAFETLGVHAGALFGRGHQPDAAIREPWGAVLFRFPGSAQEEHVELFRRRLREIKDAAAEARLARVETLARPRHLADAPWPLRQLLAVPPKGPGLEVDALAAAVKAGEMAAHRDAKGEITFEARDVLRWRLAVEPVATAVAT
jgi:hypothetical protein